jgi:acetoacetate decarboxylase
MTTPTSQSEPAGYIWTNARLLAVDVAVSGAAVSALLPAALAVSDPPTATLFIADYPETLFGSVYREAAVLLHARDDQGAALHCPWMVVDDDTALILGRELLGFPKKLAEIELAESGERVVGTVRRRGTEIMRIEAALGSTEATPAPMFGRRMVNAIGTPVTGMKLVDLAPTEEVIHASRLAEAKVALCSSERDPLGDLQAAPAATARYLRLDMGKAGGAGAGPSLLGDVDSEWLGRRFYPRAM